MSNPNRTVWQARHRVMSCVKQESFPYYAFAEVTASAWRLSGKYHRVTVRSYRLGPKRAPTIHYMVRAYNKAD